VLNHYILDETSGEPRVAKNLAEWVFWLKDADRCVKNEWVDVNGIEVCVSTIFLGIDHNFLGEGLPILWETMVFNGPNNFALERCSGTREQAEAMHAATIKHLLSKRASSSL